MSKMWHACPVHWCLTPKYHITNIGGLSYKDVADDVGRYGVIFLGFQMKRSQAVVTRACFSADGAGSGCTCQSLCRDQGSTSTGEGRRVYYGVLVLATRVQPGCRFCCCMRLRSLRHRWCSVGQ